MKGNLNNKNEYAVIDQLLKIVNCHQLHKKDTNQHFFL